VKDALLIVDDDEDVRTVLSEWARSLGYTVIEATSAEHALEAIANRSAGIAICDLCMPGQDGLWLARQLRKRLPTIGVIISTGFVEPDLPSLGPGSEGVVSLEKPFSKAQVTEALEQASEWHFERVIEEGWKRGH
jgi:CheY-like chemotaxis protein